MMLFLDMKFSVEFSQGNNAGEDLMIVGGGFLICPNPRLLECLWWSHVFMVPELLGSQFGNFHLKLLAKTVIHTRHGSKKWIQFVP